MKKRKKIKKPEVEVEQEEDTSETQQKVSQNPTINRGKVDSLCIYEITDGELEIIERGSPNSIYFNFSVFLITSAITLVAALLTTTPSQLVKIIFILVTIIFSVAGVFCVILWIKSKNEFNATIKKIRARISEK